RTLQHRPRCVGAEWYRHAAQQSTNRYLGIWLQGVHVDRGCVEDSLKRGSRVVQWLVNEEQFDAAEDHADKLGRAIIVLVRSRESARQWTPAVEGKGRSAKGEGQRAKGEARRAECKAESLTLALNS